ncbi:MAG: HK97 family phage prohead protease [Amaricoccus sp.]|uniref:HK97 family phage prohead protease n=1 Tax=Amaricoccus sp. TaxID=1872485 RepID=UPI003315A28F
MKAALLWGGAGGGLELRADDMGGARLSGRFPYNSATELGPGRRESIAGRAFRSRVEAGEEIHLLLGHDFNRPLASTRAGSLVLRDGDDALLFEATISPEMAGSTTGRDALAMIRGRLATGVSPGFIVPRGGDEVREAEGGLLRVVRSAELHELSVVTRPAYQHAQVEARSWTAVKPANLPVSPLRRWRA